MKKYILFLLLALNLNLIAQVKSKSIYNLDSNQEFNRVKGDEPWNTFDKNNIGGTLIGIGWGVTVITVFATQPTPQNKFIAYGIGGSITTSGLLYWIIKGSKYKKREKNGFKI
jgi:hypothetical protein